MNVQSISQMRLSKLAEVIRDANVGMMPKDVRFFRGTQRVSYVVFEHSHVGSNDALTGMDQLGQGKFVLGTSYNAQNAHHARQQEWRARVEGMPLSRAINQLLDHQKRFPVRPAAAPELGRVLSDEALSCAENIWDAVPADAISDLPYGGNRELNLALILAPHIPHMNEAAALFEWAALEFEDAGEHISAALLYERAALSRMRYMQRAGETEQNVRSAKVNCSQVACRYGMALEEETNADAFAVMWHQAHTHALTGLDYGDLVFVLKQVVSFYDERFPAVALHNRLRLAWALMMQDSMAGGEAAGSCAHSSRLSDARENLTTVLNAWQAGSSRAVASKKLQMLLELP